MDFRDFTSRFGREIILDKVNYLHAAPLLNTALHSHFNMLHIACVKLGFGICRVKDKIWKLAPGSIHFVMPGEIHRYVADAKKPYQIYFLHLNWYGSFFEELPRHLVIPPHERKCFFEKLNALSELFHRPDIGSDFRKYGLFSLVIADIMKFSQETKAVPLKGYVLANSQEAKLNYVFKRLYGPPFEFPGIDALAEHCEMSRRKFTALFKKLTGMTVKQYYTRNLMAYASTMMESREFKIKNIASHCGYANSQNFMSAYKKHRP